MKAPSRQRRQILLWILSLIVVGSMICSFVVMLRPPAEPLPSPQPTFALPTRPPTARPTTPSAPSPLTLPAPTRQVEITPTTPLTPTLATSPTQAAMSGQSDLAWAARGDRRGG